MIVIGFTWPPLAHDHSVAIIQDGQLIFATEEERHSRHKHAAWELPVCSMKRAFIFLKKLGIRPKDVDAYAINISIDLIPLKLRFFPILFYYN